MAPWRMWVKWNGSMAQTLIDAQHLAAGDATLAEATEVANRTGSPGILVVHQLADHKMLGRVWVLSPSELHDHFGSKMPAKKAIEADTVFIERLERGEAVAVTAFLHGLPTAVLFAGQPDLPRRATASP